MGYGDALTLAANKLGEIPPETVCKTSGARYDNGTYYLKWFGVEQDVQSASDTHKILWLHYLAANGSQNISGRLIAYREAAPALFYEPNFYKRAVNPLVKCFGKNPEALVEIGESTGGRRESLGDASITIDVLPYLPVTFVIWKGDDEFPPDGIILFDQTAVTWMSPEDLAVLASSAVYELIGIYKNKKA